MFSAWTIKETQFLHCVKVVIHDKVGFGTTRAKVRGQKAQLMHTRRQKHCGVNKRDRLLAFGRQKRFWTGNGEGKALNRKAARALRLGADQVLAISRGRISLGALLTESLDRPYADHNQTEKNQGFSKQGVVGMTFHRAFSLT
jgi:hypothetical protein